MPLEDLNQACNIPKGAKIYTSEKHGSDETGDGSEDKPLKTILQALRTAKAEPWPTIYADAKVGHGKKYAAITKTKLKKVLKLYKAEKCDRSASAESNDEVENMAADESEENSFGDDDAMPKVRIIHVKDACQYKNLKVKIIGSVTCVNRHGNLTFVTVEDGSGNIQCILGEELYQSLKSELSEKTLVGVCGIITDVPSHSKSRGGVEMKVQKVEILKKLRLAEEYDCDTNVGTVETADDNQFEPTESNEPVLPNKEENLVIEGSEVGTAETDTILDPETEAAVEKEQHESKKNAKVFPPPINWYNAAAATSRPEMFAYLAQNCLVVAKVGHFNTQKSAEEEDQAWPIFSLISQQARFKCLSLSQQEWDHLPLKDSPVVTGDDMGHVRVWNIGDKSCVIYHNVHEGAKYVSGVEWSPRDPNVIYSLDCTGCLVIWRVKEKSWRKMKVDANWTMSCLAVSPHEDNLVALGASPGNILLVDVSQDSPVTLHKMHHDEELVSLSWVPMPIWEGVKLDKHHHPNLLISAVNTVNEPTMRVWDREGNDVTILKLVESEEALAAAPPTTTTFGRRIPKTFVPHRWIKDPVSGEVNLFSSVKGSIVSFNQTSSSYEPVHTMHTGNAVFALVQTGDILWSFGRESMAVGWNLRDNKLQMTIPIIKGVCCVQSSGISGSEVAMGGSDGILRVFSMGNGYPCRAAHSIPVQTFNVDSRVTALAWHPNRDNIIGMGTADGMLGLYEYQNENRFVKRFEKRARGAVYSLDWGPSVYTKDYEKKLSESGEDRSNKISSTLMMYVCADDSVFFINPNGIKNPLINIMHILRVSNPQIQTRGTTRMTDLRWCPSRKFLCVGFFNGRIEVYSPPFLELRCWIECHKKALQCLLWRPYDFKSEAVSLSKWLASAANDGTIRMYNLASLYTSEKKEGVIDSIRSSHKTLDGHKGVRVISMAWSPYDPKLLVSVSYDQTAVVWNVTEETAIARYCGHTQRLVACLFHPSDPFSVATFSDQLASDFAMHMWDYRQFPYKDLSEAILMKVNSKKQALKVERQQKEQEPLRLEKLIVVESGTHGIFDGDEVVLEQLPPPQIDAKCNEPFLSSCGRQFREMWSEPNEILAKVKESRGGKISEDIQAMRKLIGSDFTGKSLLDEQMTLHIDNGDWKSAFAMAKLVGDSQVLEKALNLKTLNVTADMVAHVATGSYSLGFRVQVIEAYIRDLKARGDINTACEYMLTIGQEMEAIQLLRQRKMYLEAVDLAKQKLHEKEWTLLTQEIYQEWTDDLKNCGNYVDAFKLQYTLGQCDQALEIIQAWNCVVGFQIGIPLALEISRKDLAEDFVIKVIELELVEGNHSKCLELLQEYDKINVEWLKYLVEIHKGLMREINYPERGAGEGRESVRDVPRSSGYDASEVLKYLHTFIPQTKDEALVVLAKIVTVQTFFHIDDPEKKKIDEEAKNLCNEWLDPDSPLYSFITTKLIN